MPRPFWDPFWANYPDLAACGATPTPERVIEHLDRRIITAAGVSAGIDMALRLTELLADQTAHKRRSSWSSTTRSRHSTAAPGPRREMR
jgi:transcriptional regulator GlxA family with amidase domain